MKNKEGIQAIKAIDKELERLHIKLSRTSHIGFDDDPTEYDEIKDRIISKNPKKVYVFFNNNHAMLRNARTIYKMFKSSSVCTQITILLHFSFKVILIIEKLKF